MAYWNLICIVLWIMKFVLCEDDAPLQSDDLVINHFLKEANAHLIRQWNQFLSREPRLAGTPRNEEVARYIRDTWQQQGLDRAKLVSYDVLLSHPIKEKPNKVHVLDENGTIIFSTTNPEATLTKYEKTSDSLPGYCAFSPSIDVTAPAVFANFGTSYDYDQLEAEGIKVNGTIAIVEEGHLTRFLLMKYAKARGVLGIIAIASPRGFGPEDRKPENAYPHTRKMPGTATRRSSMAFHPGDPLTPGHPAINGAFRLNIEDLPITPHLLPLQPVGYGDGEVILRHLKGIPAPSYWNGDWEFTPRLGLDPGDEKVGTKIRLVINNRTERKNITNVLGIITGSQEPDRYVIVGNHRDSWVYGAVDAASGTAPLLEVTRLFGNLRKKGWSPKRTMIFCSWDGEEFGKVGSTEWVEENILMLQQRAVSYLNVDYCVRGNYFNPEATPALMNVIRTSTKYVPDPHKPEFSLYATWKKKQNVTGEPRINILRVGTDHESFAFYAGIPSMDILWKPGKEYRSERNYPAYHTAYDTFYYLDRFIDPGFHKGRSCAQLTGIILYQLADAHTILPYNFIEAAWYMRHSIKLMRSIFALAETNNISINHLVSAVGEFSDMAIDWHRRLRRVDLNDTMLVRSLNDQARVVEQAFLHPDGLPGKPHCKNIIFSPGYGRIGFRTAFPGIPSALVSVNNTRGEAEKHISDVVLALRKATAILKHPSDVWRL